MALTETVKSKGTLVLNKLTALTLKQRILVGGVVGAVILAAAGSVFLASQEPAILKSGSEITNLDALLTEAEAQYAVASDGLEQKSVDGDSALCFFQMDATKSVTDTISCGLALHASATTGSYDGINVTWTEAKSGDVTGELSGSFTPYSGDIHEGTTLRRPDGKRALDPSELTTADATQILTNDLLPDGNDYGVLEGLTAKTEALDNPVEIKTPGASNEVSVGATEVVTDSSGDEYAAPLGSQFISFSIAQTGASAADNFAAANAAYVSAQEAWSTQINSLTYQGAYFSNPGDRDDFDAETDRLKAAMDAADANVVSAERALLHWNLNIVDSVTGENIDSTQLDEDGVVSTEPYVVLVPSGTRAEVTVTVGETTQTVPLNVGTDSEVTSNNMNTLVQFAEKALVDFPQGSEIRSLTPEEGSISAAVESADLSVVSDGVYAEEGSAFVTLSVTSKGMCDATSQDAVLVGYSETDLSDADGIAYGEPTEIADEDSSSTDLVWQVDANASEFVVSLRPTFDCTGEFLMSDVKFSYEFTAAAAQVGDLVVTFTPPESGETEDDTKADTSEATSETK